MAIKILDNEITEKRDTKVSAKGTIEEYIDKSDWRISANSNTSYSAAGLCNQTYGKICANYWLDQVYSKKEGDAHRNGDYHIHDLDILAAYCFSKETKIKTVEYGDISIEDLLTKGVERFTVHSFDGERHVLSTAKNLRKTRCDAEIITVEFEDGLTVNCTPDHKFLLTDGSWKEARYLTEDDDLRSI